MLFDLDDDYERGCLGQLLGEKDTVKIQTDCAVDILNHCNKNHKDIYDEVMGDYKMSVSKQARIIMNRLKVIEPYSKLLK